MESNSTIEYFKALNNDQITKCLEECTDQEFEDIYSLVDQQYTALKKEKAEWDNESNKYCSSEYYRFNVRFNFYVKMLNLTLKTNIERKRLKIKKRFGPEPLIILLKEESEFSIGLWYNEELNRYPKTYSVKEAFHIAGMIGLSLKIPDYRITFSQDVLDAEGTIDGDPSPIPDEVLSGFANEVICWVVEQVKPKKIRKSVLKHYKRLTNNQPGILQ
ncbi:MAG: hypothetical protein K6U80_12190 [Firmicutes bacterium]|nr:hypothetical protein [Bacillota bacterium]